MMTMIPRKFFLGIMVCSVLHVKPKEKKDLGKVKAALGTVEMKQEKMATMDKTYIAKQVFKDLESTHLQLEQAKNYIMQQCVAVEKLLPAAIKDGIKEECNQRAQKVINTYETLKATLKQAGV